MYRRLFALRPLQQPAGRAQVGEAEMGIVDHPRGPDGGERRRDVDNVNIGKGFDQIGERDVGEAEAVAVAGKPALGKAERLDGRLGQIIDQDRRRGFFAQAFEHEPGVGDVAGVMRGLPGREIVGDVVARAQRADEDGVVLVFAGEGEIIGKRRRHAQVEAAPHGLAAQEVGFHVNVALAVKDHVEALFSLAKVRHSQCGPRRPIRRRAFFQFTPIALEKLDRVAPVGRAQLGGDVGDFLLRGLFGENAAFDQRLDAAFEDGAVAAHERGEAVVPVRQRPRLLEALHDPGNRRVDGEAQMADGVDEQNPVGPDRQLMHEAGCAQDHRQRRHRGPKIVRRSRPRPAWLPDG
jgi:hypothetical protein